MTLKQLNPTIPVITPKGSGLALFISWASEEHHLIWTVAQDNTREICQWENPDVRLTKNFTFQRNTITEIKREL